MKKELGAIAGATGAGVLANGGLGAGLTAAGSAVCWPLVIAAAATGYSLAWIIEGHRSRREMQEAIMASILEECLHEQEADQGKVIDIEEEA